MSFIKFPKITNHYQDKFIQKSMEVHPGLKDERFIVTEKLHGCNLQVYFEPGEAYRVASRNRFLDEGCKFYNVWGALDKMTQVLFEAKHWAWRAQKSLRLFGELHGGSVQQGVNYGSEQNILFFAAMVDDVLISPEELLALDIPHLLHNFVPVLYVSRHSWENLDTVLDFDIERNSALTPGSHGGPNLIEGVVIQPYSKVYILPCGTVFILKKKNERFLTSQKSPKHYVPVDVTVANLRAEFLLCITEARVDSIISQEGPITDIKQLGHYIVLILNDAKTDFYLEHRDLLDKKAQKYIFNVGGLIANMLKARL